MLNASHSFFFSGIMKISTLSTLTFVYITSATAKRVACLNNSHTASDAKCCVWYDILNDIQAKNGLFDGGICGDDAYDALRRRSKGDGADGSLIKYSDTELGYDANGGLDAIVMDEKALADKYGVSYGDIIQFTAAVSVRNCPGGPRIPFKAGRPNATRATPDHTVPEAFHSADTILKRVRDAGLTPNDLVELLASHSIGVQERVDPDIPGTPFDLTPDVFDTNFYHDTLSPLASTRKSDYALARDPRTTLHWRLLSASQPLMANRFAAAMDKMALLGQNAKILYDCSEVIPAVISLKPDLKSRAKLDRSCHKF
ncbi:manganese peroxidase 1 precursor [Mycena albidolilacea]|uniref:Peroxidase n=1 Tax=Mycena albidolilacea TaxID=1033008 RepID=A0AAD6ZAM7_9AGAR|nr:manganese peroxidase 1 precursor [Mycena albidolilacea]